MAFGAEKTQTASGTKAIEAEHALATFKVPPGFKIEMKMLEPELRSE